VPTRKHPRPSTAREAGDRLKLHRHDLRADGRDYQVITLRPGTRASFSTNHHHETWHVLSDPHGALLLGRLLWGLSYQRRPGTLVVIDRRFIDPNPFDAEPGNPVALVPADLTHLPARTARHLARRCAAPGTPSGTVRWHTWGLDQAAQERRAWLADRSWHPPGDDHRRAEVAQLGGLVRVQATSSLLRSWAVSVVVMADYAYDGMSYTGLAGSDGNLCRAEGEVQTFRDYRRRVSVAKVAREEVLAAAPASASPADLRPLIWDRNDTIRSRRP
jgi:hypothetical protein